MMGFYKVWTQYQRESEALDLKCASPNDAAEWLIERYSFYVTDGQTILCFVREFDNPLKIKILVTVSLSPTLTSELID